MKEDKDQADATTQRDSERHLDELRHEQRRELDEQDRQARQDIEDGLEEATRRRPAESKREDGVSRVMQEREAQPGETYSGRVVKVSERHVVQEHTNEQGQPEAVRHDRQAMGMKESTELEGKDVEISYPHGRVPLVREASHEAGREAGREVTRRQPHHEPEMGR